MYKSKYGNVDSGLIVNRDFNKVVFKFWDFDRMLLDDRAVRIL